MPGMDALAAKIKQLGLKPGIWLAAQGQSSPEVIGADRGAFLMNNNTSAAPTWEGTYLVDPSSKAGLTYLGHLFTTIKDWGYDYFKIDGQPTVLEQYRLHGMYMKHPSGNADSLYRATIMTIKKAIGPNRFLLGFAITPDGIGIDNGSRTGGDVVLGWNGFMTSVEATMRNYFLHNVVWYCDPDVMILRYPLTRDQARAWATLQGLTGELLMSTGRLPDLSSRRVEIMKSVFPAQNIRPLDLFPSKASKHIWDLKINHLGKNYDVVGLFDFDRTKSKTLFLKWQDLGYSDTSIIRVFDFWNKEYLGAWRKGIAVTLSPTSCRVLTLLGSNGHIQLISTNRHITQGYPDLQSFKVTGRGTTFHGVRKVIGGEEYALYFAFPRGKGFAVKEARAGRLEVKVENHQGWAAIQFTSPATDDVKWNVVFTPSIYYHYPVYTSYKLIVNRNGMDGAAVHWKDYYGLNLGSEVYVDGTLAGYTPTTTFPLTNLNPDSDYKVTVKEVWEDGVESANSASTSIELRKMIPDKLPLSELTPVYGSAGWDQVKMNFAISGKTLSIGGRSFECGIGTQTGSHLRFKVLHLYKRFVATVGIDDNTQAKSGKVRLSVYGHGRRLWQSGTVTLAGRPVPVSVSIEGVNYLTLNVENVGSDGKAMDVDWADAKLEKLEK